MKIKLILVLCANNTLFIILIIDMFLIWLISSLSIIRMSLFKGTSSINWLTAWLFICYITLNKSCPRRKQITVSAKQKRKRVPGLSLCKLYILKKHIKNHLAAMTTLVNNLGFLAKGHDFCITHPKHTPSTESKPFKPVSLVTSS